MADPPKRRDSTAPTGVLPRVTRQDLDDVMLTDMLADAERARREHEDTVDTLVACPGPCTACPCCKGTFMISHEHRQQWLADYDPPPSSKPEAA